MSKRTLAIALALVTLAVCSAAQEMTVGELRAIGEGRALYVRYCSGCHGSLVTPGVAANAQCPELTQILARDGRFDKNHVKNQVRFGNRLWWEFDRPDGKMPGWRHAHAGSRGEGEIECELEKLVRYLEFAQTPVHAANR
jgi:mono/diheme cytochrome c family protein